MGTIKELSQQLKLEKGESMKKSILLKFLGVTFGFSWSLFILARVLTESLQFIAIVLGAFGPVVGALLSMKFWVDAEERTAFKKRMLKWQVGWKWFMWPVVFVFISLIIHIGVQASLGTVTIVADRLKQAYLIIPMILVMLIGGGQEEIGWRGFMLPQLMKSYSPNKASIIVGFIWGIWHIPLFIIPGMPQYGESIVIFTLACIYLSLFMTYVYCKTGSSLIGGYWFHMVSNGVQSFFYMNIVQELKAENQIASYLVAIGFIIIGYLINSKWKDTSYLYQESTKKQLY